MLLKLTVKYWTAETLIADAAQTALGGAVCVGLLSAYHSNAIMNLAKIFPSSVMVAVMHGHIKSRKNGNGHAQVKH